MSEGFTQTLGRGEGQPHTETIRLLMEAEERKLAGLTQGGGLPRRASVLDTTSRIGCHAPEQAG